LELKKLPLDEANTQKNAELMNGVDENVFFVFFFNEDKALQHFQQIVLIELSTLRVSVVLEKSFCTIITFAMTAEGLEIRFNNILLLIFKYSSPESNAFIFPDTNLFLSFDVFNG
jgi:hypothetical protein